MSIVASLIVTFGSGADSSALVKMEFDKVMNVDAAGEEKNSFSPGDEIFFLVHHDSTVQVDRIKATSGMVVDQGPVNRDRTQELLFRAITDTHELDYILAGGITAKWYGNEGTGLKKSGNRTVLITGGVMPAQVAVSYSVAMRLYKLVTPAVELAEDESWPITIVAYVVPA